MSISTLQGDGGQTSLAGGFLISKSDLRVEAYGTIDERISSMGMARASCANAEVRKLADGNSFLLFHKLSQEVLKNVCNVGPF